MNLLVGLPIIAGSVLGFIFPYLALKFSYLAFYVLLLLLALSSLKIEWETFKKINSFKIPLILSLIYGYGFFVILQWGLAKLFVNDPAIFLGVTMSAICPIALVAPIFTSKIKGRAELSFLIMIISTILFPALLYFYLKFLKIDSIGINFKPIFFDILILSTLPILFGGLIGHFGKEKIKKLAPFLPYINTSLIGFLAFVYMGSSYLRINFDYDFISAVVILIFLAMIQDFGVLVTSKYIFSKILASEDSKALSVSLSMKNVAIAGGILLFYDPKASFAASVVFVTHAFLFSTYHLFFRKE